jgi:hypothetical protein
MMNTEVHQEHQHEHAAERDNDRSARGRIELHTQVASERDRNSGGHWWVDRTRITIFSGPRLAGVGFAGLLDLGKTPATLADCSFYRTRTRASRYRFCPVICGGGMLACPRVRSGTLGRPSSLDELF